MTDSARIAIDRLDHLVLTVRDVERSCRFYATVLGMRVVRFDGGRTALHFGNQKINLHVAGHELAPHADRPLPGSADLCFLTPVPLPQLIDQLEANGVELVAGPVRQTGATGPMESVYIRDPDGNLIELANPLPDEGA